MARDTPGGVPQEREVPARRTHGLPTWGDGRARLSSLRDNSK
jgi:hypothetical protein